MNNSILEKCRLRLRKTNRDYDEDISQLIEAATDDLVRMGIREECIHSSASPLIEETIITFVQANFGENPNSERLMQCYDSYCRKLLASEYRSGEDE